MFTTVQTFSPSFTSLKRSSSSKRSSSLVVRAQRSEDFVQQIGKHAAVIATALVLTLTPPAEAAVPAKKLTSFQKEQAYQAEMQAAIKARTGKATALPSLTASPTDFKVAETKSTTLKFTDSVEKVKIETPAAVPAPEPAVPAAAAAAVVVAAPKPTPKPAPIAVTVAPAPAPTPAPVKAAVTAAPVPSAAAPAPAGDNKNLIGVAGIAILALAGAAAANNGSTEEGGVAAAAAAPAAVATSASDGIPPNVAEARAWIGAWKQKHGKK